MDSLRSPPGGQEYRGWGQAMEAKNDATLLAPGSGNSFDPDSDTDPHLNLFLQFSRHDQWWLRLLPWG